MQVSPKPLPESETRFPTFFLGDDTQEKELSPKSPVLMKHWTSKRRSKWIQQEELKEFQQQRSITKNRLQTSTFETYMPFVKRQERITKGKRIIVLELLLLTCFVVLTIVFGFKDSCSGVSLTAWTMVSLATDLIQILREIVLLRIFRKFVNPKKADLLCHFIQIFIIWGFTLAWTIFGTILLQSNNCGNPYGIDTVMWFVLAQNWITVFFCAMILPKLLYQMVAFSCAHVYLIIFNRHYHKFMDNHYQFFLSKLIVTTHDSFSNNFDTCTICMEPYLQGQILASGRCSKKHQFHYACLAKWGKNSFQCPVCRQIYPHSRHNNQK